MPVRLVGLVRPSPCRVVRDAPLVICVLVAWVAAACTAEISSVGPSRMPPAPPPPADRPLPPPTTDGQPPTGAVKGLLDCPTAPLPAYTGTLAGELPAADVALSEPFQRSCRGCHGATGQGGGRYPELPGSLDFEAYRAVVRDGRGAMPAFASSFISDAELRADYDALRALRSTPIPDDVPRTGEWAWSDAQVEAAYTRGLAAFRKPDPAGFACANCHAPDALDLAVIAYPDDAILRRAALHVSPEDGASIVDLVHAQRRRYNVGEPCSRDWRPLQPGGAPLPGDTPEAQDLSFAHELVARGSLLATGRVETLADAYDAVEEMVQTDLKRLPIGIPLPRWTEDGFNGPAHSTINDYLMGVGRVPKDPAAWYALENRYVSDPSEANFFEILHRMTDETTDLGFSERTERAWIESNGRCNLINREAGGLMTFVDETKRRSLFVVQHLMRMAVLGRPGWFEQPTAPFVEYARRYGEGLNPFDTLGAQLAEHNCRNTGAMWASWPDEPAEEIPASDLAAGVAEEMSRQLNHPWQTLGMIFDPTLLMQEDFAQENNLHYWVLNGFVQDEVHMPFLYFHRIANQEHYYRELVGTDLHPPLGLNWHGRRVTNPILEGDRLFFKTGNTTAVHEEDPRARVSNTVRCNAFRALLLLQKERFDAGTPGRNVTVSGNQISSLTQHYDAWSVFARQLANRGGERALADAYAGRGELCMAGLERLIEETRAAASRVDDLAD